MRVGAKRNDNNDYNRNNNSFANLDYNRDNIISRSEWSGDRGAFDRMDCNYDSQLTRDEYLSRTECNATVSNDSFRNLDTNNNGVLSRNEWRSDSSTFDRMDCNRDSQLTRDEYLSRTECNTTVSNDSFRNLDTNNNGVLSRN